MLRKLFRNRLGQGLVEYAMLIAGVALICAVGISMFGHKTSDMIDAVATVLPGAHADDNGAITSGNLIETTQTNGAVALDLDTIKANSNTARLGAGTVGNATTGFDGLVVEAGS